jgi:hypothetical protein
LKPLIIYNNCCTTNKRNRQRKFQTLNRSPMIPVFFTKQTDIRAWLEKNHQQETELIVGFYKVNRGIPRHSYLRSPVPIKTKNSNKPELTAVFLVPWLMMELQLFFKLSVGQIMQHIFLNTFIDVRNIRFSEFFSNDIFI